MNEPLPTISVHLHCTACGGRGVFDGRPCWCVTDRRSCATCKFWLVPDRAFFEGDCTNPESPFNREYLHRNDGCQQHVALK